MRRLLVLFFLLFSPLVARAQANVDLGFQSREDIFFSTSTFVAGDRVRVYARVTNFGLTDVRGTVTFSQGTITLGNAQTISVRAGGAQEEVFVDFTVPASNFNVRAEIQGMDPADENTDNNIVITNVLTPMVDDDHDGIVNASDNCPSLSNSDQANTDGDGSGNACDDDDDNDTLTDVVEIELGTDPLKIDTDGDGIADASDPNPTGAPEKEPVVTPQKSRLATNAPSTTTEPTPNAVLTTPSTTDETTPPSSDSSVQIDGATLQAATETTTQAPAQTGETIVRPSGLAYKQVNWDTYEFAMRGLKDGARVAWNFADGSTSSKMTVDHTFRQPGSYSVKATVTNVDGTESTDSVEITVSFFHFENPAVKFVLSALLFFLLIGCTILVRLRKLRERSSL